MKVIALFCALALLAPALAYSAEPVVRVMDGEVPIIIDGNWIYPPFNLVLTDSNITVNGYEYAQPKVKKETWAAPPDKEKDFFDWLVRTSVDSAWAAIDSGGTFEDAESVMKRMICRYADDDTLKVVYGDGAFELKFYKNKMSLFVTVPTGPREPVVSYREGFLEPRFRVLAKMIECDYLIIKGSKYERGIPPRKQHLVIPELVRLSRLDTLTVDVDESPIVIPTDGRPIRLYRSLILDLMYPKSK